MFLIGFFLTSATHSFDSEITITFFLKPQHNYISIFVAASKTPSRGALPM